MFFANISETNWDIEKPKKPLKSPGNSVNDRVNNRKSWLTFFRAREAARCSGKKKKNVCLKKAKSPFPPQKKEKMDIIMKMCKDSAFIWKQNQVYRWNSKACGNDKVKLSTGGVLLAWPAGLEHKNCKPPMLRFTQIFQKQIEISKNRKNHWKAHEIL